MRYTGSASSITYKDKVYTESGFIVGPDGKREKVGSYDHIPMSEAEALNLIQHSKHHSFQTAGGKDLLDAVTSPGETVVPAPAVPVPAAPASGAAASAK